MKVKSLDAYERFILGRDMDNALHREDGSAGYVVGEVKALRPGDVAIDEAEYNSLADVIKAYNASLPPPPPLPPDPLLAEIDAIDTLAKARVALRKVAERMR